METLSPAARTWAEIDCNALLHNFNIARRTGKKVMCVIKADAYGHGAVRCGRFLERHGADAFAVACLQEALDLRAGGITRPVLILGHTSAEYAALLAANTITQTVVDESAANELDAAARAAGVTVDVHIKLDTGMLRGRAGWRERARKTAWRPRGGRAHLPSAQPACNGHVYALLRGRYACGRCVHRMAAGKLYAGLPLSLGKGLRPETCHTSNSACILAHPETQIDMVREGIILYGMYPNSVPQKGELRPVMTLKTRVSQVRALPAGTTVSYGRTYRSDAPFQTAVMLAGYADGYPRRLSNNTTITIHGKRYPQVGRICMDMCMANITGAEDIARGDEVTLIGGDSITWEEAAEKVGTINYELTCLVTARTKRIYLNED